MTAGHLRSPALRLVLVLPLAAGALPALSQTAVQKATRQTVQQAAANRAVERCTALARQQNIRLGKLEGAQPAGPGVLDVRWARPFFGKPQLCRYEVRRDSATFAGEGGPAALPAAVPVDDKATREAAMGACQRLFTSMGKGSPIPTAIKPAPGGFLDLEMAVGDSTMPMEKCRYDVRKQTAEYVR